MSGNMYGQPGTVYAPLGGRSYSSDGTTGLILNVTDADKGDLLRAGCVDASILLNAQAASNPQVLKLSGVPINGITYAGHAPIGTLLVTDQPALYQNIGSNESPEWAPLGGPGGFNLIGALPAANMNSTNDQQFNMLPSRSGRFRIRLITVANASGILDTAVGGVYTDVNKGGTAIVGSSQAYSALASPDTALDLSILSTPGDTFWPASTPLILSLTTPQGVVAIADFSVFGNN